MAGPSRSATATTKGRAPFLPAEVRAGLARTAKRLGGLGWLGAAGALGAALLTYTPTDPSFNTAGPGVVRNALGLLGAGVSDALLQTVGLASAAAVLVMVAWGIRLIAGAAIGWTWLRTLGLIAAMLLLTMGLAPLGRPEGWPVAAGLGGAAGSLLLANAQAGLMGLGVVGDLRWVMAGVAGLLGAAALLWASAVRLGEWRRLIGGFGALGRGVKRGVDQGVESGAGKAAGALSGLSAVPGMVGGLKDRLPRLSLPRLPLSGRGGNADGADDDDGYEVNPSLRERAEPVLVGAPRAAVPAAQDDDPPFDLDPDDAPEEPRPARRRLRPEPSAAAEPLTVVPPAPPPPPRTPGELIAAPPPRTVSKRDLAARQGSLLPDDDTEGYHLPPLELLGLPTAPAGSSINEDALAQNARLLEGVLSDFGVNGRIVKVRPGPVVTLYELEPAPGTKTSRVVGLADDIARSMSAVSVRIAVVPGQSTIGIELPNAKREVVNFRELLAADAFHKDDGKQGGGLTLALGRDIGGSPTYVDLAKMPHLLIAGTTGSGKSVAVNTMICSLLYRLRPEQCRFIMIDPKMLELSVYDGIPHLLTPVVTDPGKAVVALKWAVKEMENRYRAMSQMGVRNIAGYNTKLEEARKAGKSMTRTVQTGFDPETGKPIYEEQELDMTPLPFIVVIVDEMADLMLVAGKDVEAAIQRLAQMARAAGIHLIMATQRPSVDVITGTIKANFPTRISFQVTSKIDSRTILGEQGAEQLLGQGDMLYMAAGGRITRVHGPFVSDTEVEEIVTHLRDQGEPDYMEAVTDEEEAGGTMLDLMTGGGGGGDGESGDALFDQAVAVVARERKASTSFIQRHLQIGYNRAARIIERMEAEGMVGKPNHVGKREVLLPPVGEEY
ncbi:DNA translocase FtsK 4TM domain-containing protein [Novispirillum sp. DQ9]|uniref:FtsK/SpoIIIE family DNA translocase n=1 Tax=Novispirillum sp. DQ9 TaxID=3398612 RepID=UPI003C7BA273